MLYFFFVVVVFVLFFLTLAFKATKIPSTGIRNQLLNIIAVIPVLDGQCY